MKAKSTKGSNPNHTIYTLIVQFCQCLEKKNEYKQKEAEPDHI